MNMNLLQSVLMGLVSGFAEVLPISAEAHRALMRTFFGMEYNEPVFLFLVHMACLAALAAFHSSEILKLRRTSALMKIQPKRRRVQPEMSSVFTVRHLKSAAIVMIVLRLFGRQLSFIAGTKSYLGAAVILNGIILFLPKLVRSANKDSRNMLRVDGLVMGLGAGLGAVPGVSGVGAALSFGIMRGVDRKYALNFVYMLLIPCLVVELALDVLALVGGGLTITAGGLAVALIGAVCAGIGSWLGMRMMKFLAFSAGFSGFSYYCWGFGLICLILFLTI